MVSKWTAEHSDYPHEPGTLYDCEACETECYCWELNHRPDGTRRWVNTTVEISCMACELDEEML